MSDAFYNPQQGITIHTAAIAGALTGNGTSPNSVAISQSGAANLAVTRVTSSGTAQTLFVARDTRTSVVVRNTDAANYVWIGPATITSGNGFLLKAGESLPFTFVGLLQVIDDGSNHAVIHVADEYG